MLGLLFSFLHMSKMIDLTLSDLDPLPVEIDGFTSGAYAMLVVVFWPVSLCVFVYHIIKLTIEGLRNEI